MLFRAGDEDTICALSTPPGTGGIGVIRVSGALAADISRRICRFLPEVPESHRAYYGICTSVSDQRAVDEVLATFFAAGRSFTGEETVEISCHGGPVIVRDLLNELISAGARMANRGEFTYRAFMNGRLDLVQAESVLGLIESRSKQAAKVALRQLRGDLSQEYSRLEDGLVWLLAHLEASIDFSTEDIEVVETSVLETRVAELEGAVGRLITSYSHGRILREGIEVALVGRPNAGKSSLLNAFLREDRAIVTPHAGTTRDTVEGRVSYHGVPVTFVDTAGLRETENEIEKIGIERSLKAMENADFVFHVFDLLSGSIEADIRDVSAKLSPRDHLVLNKSDLDPSGARFMELTRLITQLGTPMDKVFALSALDLGSLTTVEAYLSSQVAQLEAEDSNVVTQARHLELLQKIHSCLEAALRLIRSAYSPEFIAFELQDAVRSVHELLGKEFNEQVIDRIFKEFCLGK